ncbi:MAG: phage tail sheath subtilisin-like domain-containing protein [Algoriphagus sp.]|nr:phage tail sheath subtilisin-like domain-containing protein [Algoriphagus sp.]
MKKRYKTPGVYIEEINIFPSSIIAAESAVPAFIGYTEKAEKSGKSLLNIPTRINSLLEFIELFGGFYNPKFILKEAQSGDPEAFPFNGQMKKLELQEAQLSFLYSGICLFFQNGGQSCFIVSVGTYWGKDQIVIQKDALTTGLDLLEKEPKITLVIIPDSLALGGDSFYVFRAMLSHCAKMQNRFAILDVPNGFNALSPSMDPILNFREKIGTENLSYGAAYYPWLHTNILSSENASFKNLDSNISLKSILPEPSALSLLESTPKPSDKILHQSLVTISPTYALLMSKMLEKLNLLPPASALAGIYQSIDMIRGVWKAPANVALNGVIQPAIKITQTDQENLNIDATTGKSINAIRTFIGMGTLVWGARTLAGNNLDWRYISVKRTALMIQDSIGLALKAFVFEPNDANTWITVKSMVENFLMDLWKNGALMGNKPDQAFSVKIGLGETITSQDILEKRMIMTVLLALVRPAEFIVISFSQKMES